MNANVDYASFELGLARPALRHNLRFTLHESTRGQWYVVEDEASSTFYRIGRAEYTFLSLLDGQTTVQSAMAATAGALGTEAFTEAEAATLCKWLVDANLIEKERIDCQRNSNARRRHLRAKQLQWFNPIILRVPLGNPDRLVRQLTKWLGWMVCWPAAALWWVVCAYALMLLLSQGERLYTRPSPILSNNNWLWLGLTWLSLRAVHETAHAVTCKRFGGTVREWGVLLLLFVPLPYVDVTSTWRFPDRGRRVLTSAAGMIAELFLAAIATMVWCHAQSDLLRQQAMNVMLSASLTTLLFNANPLMRFDGYHIMADFLEAPNLWTHGRQYVRGLARRLYLGLQSPMPPWPDGCAMLGRAYGLASFTWTVLVVTSLTLAALSCLEGIGVVLALLATAMWFALPTGRVIRFLVCGTRTERPNRTRCALAVSVTAVSLLLAGYWMPAPSVISAPVVIEHDPLALVRNRTPGFIAEVRVVTGQIVARDEVLCLLENIELETDLTEARLELRQADLRVRAYQASGEAAAMQIEQETMLDVLHRVRELQHMVDDLTIRAPIDGAVLSTDLNDRLGAFVEAGSDIVTVGAAPGKCAIALVPQEEVQSLGRLADAPAKVRVWGEYAGSLTGRVRRIAPRAQIHLPHFSFAAPAGGPLTVVESTSPPKDSADSPINWLLSEPHVQIEIELEPAAAEQVSSGQTGIMYVWGREGSFGAWLASGISRRISKKLQRTHGL